VSNSLNKCKLRHGWIKPFLAAIKNGYSEKNAANMSGESTATIHQYAAKDAAFKAQYEAAQAGAKPRGTTGGW
jgi:hypothetical protein